MHERKRALGPRAQREPSGSEVRRNEGWGPGPIHSARGGAGFGPEKKAR